MIMLLLVLRLFFLVLHLFFVVFVVVVARSVVVLVASTKQQQRGSTANGSRPSNNIRVGDGNDDDGDGDDEEEEQGFVAPIPWTHRKSKGNHNTIYGKYVYPDFNNSKFEEKKPYYMFPDFFANSNSEANNEDGQCNVDRIQEDRSRPRWPSTVLMTVSSDYQYLRGRSARNNLLWMMSTIFMFTASAMISNED